jgi:ubiquinone/menaquinone biosynthesis C-methylase UbiE
MMVKVPSTSYERISARYERERGGQARATAVAEALLAWLTPGRPAVDVGVGTGIIAKTLTDRGVPIIGIDIADGMLSQAFVRLPGSVVLADAQELPLAPGSLGAAVFVWSLHHIGDPVAALREARRVLDADGHVIVVSATPDNVPDDVHVVFRKLDVLAPPREADWIMRAASSAGLRPTATTHIHLEVARSPLELVRQIEDRLYSPLWDLSAEEWNTVVVPIMDELRGLEDPDRKRVSTLHSPVYRFGS